MSTLDKRDIQSVVLTGFPEHPHATFVFLQVVDAPATRAWLARLVPSVTTTDVRTPGPQVVNVAFSATGLRALGLDDDALSTFSHELQEGMAGTDHRSRVLGDTGDSAPDRWAWGGRYDRASAETVDVMLLCYGRTKDDLDTLLSSLRRGYREPAAMTEVYVRDTQVMETATEHFGFADGISQPRVAGSGARAKPGSPLIAAGEFVLGYPNAYEKLPPAPSVRAALDPQDHLPRVPVDPAIPEGEQPTRRDLGRNGTYLVVRDLAQDVQGFWQAMYERSGPTEAERSTDVAVRLAAKCVGRWPGGAPLVLSPDSDDPRLREANDFTYQDRDPHGLACPIGAHIRRTNPRDSLEPTPEISLHNVDRRRILRRGRSYGPPLGRFERESTPKERGLLFVVVNANIRRQFEFIQQTWINNPKFNGLHEDKDPLVADQDPEAYGTFTIPERPVRRQLTGLPRFVHVRGGEYFFLPGIRALRALSSLGD